MSKILIDKETGQEYEVLVSQKNVAGNNVFVATPIPAPAKSLEDEVRIEVDASPGWTPFGPSFTALCRVLDRRLKQLSEVRK